jgi:hypothetical protein
LRGPSPAPPVYSELNLEPKTRLEKLCSHAPAARRRLFSKWLNIIGLSADGCVA